MTAKRKLIRRNAHKMIAKIFEDSTTAKVYTLNNGFVGESVGVEWVKEHTANISHAEYYDNLNGTYTIRIHSNLWYDLASENTEPDSEPDVTPSKELTKRWRRMARLENACEMIEELEATIQQKRIAIKQWKKLIKTLEKDLDIGGSC